MTWTTWIAFVLVSLAATFSPGPGVMLAISTAVDSGARRTLYSSGGNALGVLIVASVAVSGVGLLLRQSPAAFGLLKLGGAAYLIYLGVRQWRAAAQPLQLNHGASLDRMSAFRRGLLVALSNPKGIVFFMAIFPQFMPAAEVTVTRFLLLIFTFIPCVLLSHGSYVLLARSLRSVDRSANLSWVKRTGGAAFVLMGCAMLSLSA